MHIPGLPYDIAAIDAWRSDLRREASRVEAAVAALASAEPGRIEFEGRAADRYAEHLTSQRIVLARVLDELSVVASRSAAAAARAQELNLRYEAEVRRQIEAQYGGEHA